MVVNTTIYADAEVIVLTNKAMKDLLEELMKEYCSAKERAKNLTSDVNCEIKEYECMGHQYREILFLRIF